jgi:hypothetical protein
MKGSAMDFARASVPAEGAARVSAPVEVLAKASLFIGAAWASHGAIVNVSARDRVMETHFRNVLCNMLCVLLSVFHMFEM